MERKYEIKDLESLLGLKLNKDETSSYVAKSLLPAGENYGSTMLAVDVTIKNAEKIIKQRHYVAKMCPVSAMMKEMFDTPVTYKKEMTFYTKIVPAMQKFQRENNVSNVIDCFSPVKGARISLDPKSDRVDDDAALLFPNLKLEGFDLVDRMKGFDLECAELVLRDLAAFHAIPLALKKRDRKRFDEEIARYVGKSFKFLTDEVVIDYCNKILDIIRDDAKCGKYVDRVKKAMEFGQKCYEKRPPIDEHFATMTHNDFWVNNTMIKFENGRPVKNIIVDFQILDYGSPADDVVFFLFSSVQSNVVEQHYDKLINAYWSTFLDTLRQLQCNTETFSLKLFTQELYESARTRQFFHVLLMLRPIFTQRGKAPDLTEITEFSLMQDDEMSKKFPRKVRHVVREFVKRNWI